MKNIRFKLIKYSSAIFIQARLGSKRYPNKITMNLYKSNNCLEFLIKRILKVFDKKSIFLLTTKKMNDKKLKKIANELKINFFQGSEKNLIKRYLDCAKHHGINNIIRITADCPYVDPLHIKKNFEFYIKQNKFNYISNCTPYEKRTFAVGNDIEIFQTKYLEKALKMKLSNFQKEHISPFFLKFVSNIYLINNKSKDQKLRFTLDYPEDLVLLKKLTKCFSNPFLASYNKIIKILKKNKKLREINEKYVKIYYKKKIKNNY